VSVPIVSRTSTSGPLPCRQQTNWYPFPVVTRQQTSGRRPPSLPRASDVFTCAPFVRSPPMEAGTSCKAQCVSGCAILGRSTAEVCRGSERCSFTGSGPRGRRHYPDVPVCPDAAMSQSSTMQQHFSIINVAASDSPNPSAMVAIASAIRPSRFSISRCPRQASRDRAGVERRYKARRALSSMNASRSSAQRCDFGLVGTGR
jgi:hypothetical protein